MRTDWVESARGLRGLIESEAEAIEAGSALTAPVVDAIDDAGLFRLMAPAEFGGAEADVATVVGVCEELGYADGATGWAYAQNITTSAYSAYLDPSVGARVAGGRAAAGMFAPLGTAEAVDGGYRVQGSYGFGSGSTHADFVGGAALVMRDGEIAPIENDRMPVIGFLLPADRVELAGNWDVMGLRGTGSQDFRVPEQVVEAGATWWIFPTGVAPRHTGGSLYGLGAVVIGTIGSVGWALGVARRALDEIVAIAEAGRTRLGSDPLAEQMVFQRDLGHHLTSLVSARLLVVDAYEAAVDAVDRDVPVDDFRARIRETKAAATHAVALTRAATTFAWEASGSQGIRNPSVLQRCYRDMAVGAGHQVFDQRNLLELAKARLGLELSGF